MYIHLDSSISDLADLRRAAMLPALVVTSAVKPLNSPWLGEIHKGIPFVGISPKKTVPHCVVLSSLANKKKTPFTTPKKKKKNKTTKKKKKKNPPYQKKKKTQAKFIQANNHL